MDATRHVMLMRLAGLCLAGFLAATVSWNEPLGAEPGPTQDPGTGICTVTGTQTADAAQIEIGRAVGLELTVRAHCPVEVRGRADILLLLDTSASMGELGKFEAAQTAVRRFVDVVDFNRHRVGLVPFNDTAYVAQTLTTRTDRLFSALDSIDRPQGSTDIAAAITLADRELQATARADAVPVVALLTDGQSSEEPMLAAATRAEDNGAVIFTVGLGPDAAHDALRRVATTPDHYYFAPGPEDLAEIYDRIANTILTFTVTDVALIDRLGPGVTYVSGTGQPTEPSGTRELRWWRAYLPEDDVALRYELQVFRAGLVQPSEALWAEYTDGDGVRRRASFTPATVEVTVPEIHSVYLPISWRNQCVPAKRWADVVLVIDASASMKDENKLGQAVAAAKIFVDLMTLPADQAAVVSYDAQATLVQELTGDRIALERALAGLAPGAGTRLDRGLDLATREFMSPRRRPANRPVIVFLSDGRQVEARERVPDAAEFARDLGITVFTIALGRDADRDLLREVAGDPSRAYYAPGPEALAEIYGQVAGVVGCR